MNYIIFKLTESCNLKCAYCSAQVVEVWQKTTMPFDTFKKAADLYIESSLQPTLNFVFHGGEPLILPISFLEACMDYSLEKGAKHGKKIIFSMQTNGTIFTPKVVELLKRYKIGASTSLDGLPAMNDQLRQKGDLVIQNVARFREAGINLAVITLVTKHNWDKFPKIISYFLEHGLNAVKVNPCYTVGHGQDLEPLTSDELFQAKKDFLDHMIDTELEGAVDINLVHEIRNFVERKSYVQSTTPTCRDKFCAGGITMAGVNNEGDFFPCVRSVGLNEKWKLGNVHEPLDVKAYNATLNQFHAKDLHYMGCETCEASRICTHGCTAFAKSSLEGDLLECLYTKRMYQYFLDRRVEIYMLYDKIIEHYRGKAEPGKKARIPALAFSAIQGLGKTFSELSEKDELELLGRQGTLLLFRYKEQKLMYDTVKGQLSVIDDLAYQVIKHFDHLEHPVMKTSLLKDFEIDKVNQVVKAVSKVLGQTNAAAPADYQLN